MRKEKLEIEQILENGWNILKEHPELAEMSISDVIDELDGSEQMIRDRWGVTAHIVCNSIPDKGNKSLIQYLSKLDVPQLTCEYTGYLLQSKFGISLETLILEADNESAFDDIVDFVGPNLKFLQEISVHTVRMILNMLQKYIEHNSYSTFLYNYAIGIASCDAYQILMEEFGDLTSNVQYHLFSNLKRYWFEKDVNEACSVIPRMLEFKSIWSKKTAIDYWEKGIAYDRHLFKQHFLQMEHLLRENDELWRQIIPTFMTYVNETNQEEKLSEEYCSSMTYLNEISTGTVESKKCFFTNLRFMNELSEDLRTVYEAILFKSFNQDSYSLDCLDFFWYGQIEAGHFQDIISDMLSCFCSNQFLMNYSHFFESIDSSLRALAKYDSTVTEKALQYMLSKKLDERFFGLGLLLNVGSINALCNEKQQNSPDFLGLFTDTQLIQLMKLILYFSVDDSQTCHFAFQLLRLAKEAPESYIEFCIDEVYSDYPVTLYEVTAHYKDSDIDGQFELGKKVYAIAESVEASREKVSNIMDLQSSWEHQYIYRKALSMQSKQINKMAAEKSFLARFVSNRTLKYGIRSGHIVKGAKKEKFYQEIPFQKIEKKMEIAAGYVKDPVEFQIRRSSYLNEVILYETDC